MGYAPFSALERGVLDAAAFLRSEEFRTTFPAAGDDYKIMGVRSGTEISLTIALAMIDRYVGGTRDYFAIKTAIHRCLAERFPRVVELSINALDDPEASSEGGIYLTVTGLSAEMGDDGQVGRGNRVNGLITPARHMSLEAAGKNPVSHVGEIYNALANAIACDVCAQIREVTEASVQLVSRIGQRVGSPWMTVVEVAPVNRLTNAIKARVEAIVAKRLETVETLIQQLIRGEIALY